MRTDLYTSSAANTLVCVANFRRLRQHRIPRLDTVAKARHNMSVQEYIDKHDLSKKVEEVINACVKAKPDEPISFMVCYLQRALSLGDASLGGDLDGLQHTQKVKRTRRPSS